MSEPGFYKYYMWSFGAGVSRHSTLDGFVIREIMLNPVVAADGHTYERAQIEMWLTNHTTSPMTGADLGDTTLRENIIVRGMVQDFLDECRAAGTDPHSHV